ncbi:MAG: M23 family metallopeptidase [Coleofasciculaceae cyanobacterium SM2_3_26]|nr:M23 family metallopeptidase [Coleofasciculaceae cyanobacterium SM2_3_26]
MKLNIPDCYTVVITRTGRGTAVFSLRVTTILLCFAGVLAFVGSVTHVVHQKYLEQEAIEQDARTILERVELLEAEIVRLRRRSGMTDKENSSNHPDVTIQSGGVAVALSTERLLEAARIRAELLSMTLDRQVKPALEKTLAREEARPQGLPLPASNRITSEFGPRRNPFGGSRYEFHEGIDFAGDYGEPVYATAPGVVVAAKRVQGYGNQVVISHGYRYSTVYAHLAEIKVRAGDRVERGRAIGTVGSTGRSTGTHLHYAVYYDSQAVDPKSYLGSVRPPSPTD